MASGLRPHGHQVAGQNRHALCAREGVRIESQVTGQFYIHLDQAWSRDRRRVYPSVEVLGQARVCVFKTKEDSVVGA